MESEETYQTAVAVYTTSEGFYCMRGGDEATAFATYLGTVLQPFLSNDPDSDDEEVLKFLIIPFQMALPIIPNIKLREVHFSS